MFTKVMPPEARLQKWRNFRESYDVSAGPDALLEEFDSIKILPRYLDFWTPSTWPNVFDIVAEGHFCQSGVTLVMAATLHNLGFINSKEIQLDSISNFETGREGLVLVYNNECYNFLPGKIVDLQHARNNSSLFETHIITIDKLYA